MIKKGGGDRLVGYIAQASQGNRPDGIGPLRTGAELELMARELSSPFSHGDISTT
jgi:hypothetical protein